MTLVTYLQQRYTVHKGERAHKEPLQLSLFTICQRSSDPHIVNYYIKWVTTSWPQYIHRTGVGDLLQLLLWPVMTGCKYENMVYYTIKKAQKSLLNFLNSFLSDEKPKNTKSYGSRLSKILHNNCIGLVGNLIVAAITKYARTIQIRVRL